jgi:hypothetical protein
MVRGLDQALHDSAHINQAPRRLVFVPARCAPACLLEEAVWLARGFQRTAGRMQHLLRVVSGAKSHRARAARVSADPSGARLYRRCLRLGVAGAFNRARNRIPARSSRRMAVGPAPDFTCRSIWPTRPSLRFSPRMRARPATSDSRSHWRGGWRAPQHSAIGFSRLMGSRLSGCRRVADAHKSPSSPNILTLRPPASFNDAAAMGAKQSSRDGAKTPDEPKVRKRPPSGAYAVRWVWCMHPSALSPSISSMVIT